MVASRYCDKSDQRQDEATVIREVLAVTIETNDGHDKLMQKWDLWTTIRVRSLECRVLFETAEPNISKESPDQSLLKKLVST